MQDFRVLSIFHFIVKATDFDRSLEFYRKLGFQPLRDGTRSDRAGERQALLGIGSTPEQTRLLLMESLAPGRDDSPASIGEEAVPQIIALRVDNARAMSEYLQSQGINTFAGEPRGSDGPSRTKGTVSLRDPDDNLIDLIESEDVNEGFAQSLDSVLPIVQTPNIFDAMETQLAMRRLRPDPVPDEYVKKLLWAGTRAPNGANRQPWRFVTVRDPELKRELQRLYSESFERNARGAIEMALKVLPPEEARPIERMFKSGQWLAEHLHEVPVIILACMLPYDRDDNPLTGGSIYPAIQNILLAARALGLGSCLTTIVRENQPPVRSLFGIPEDVPIAAQLPIGWPMGRFRPVRRRPLEEVTYLDRWGRPMI